MLTHAHIKALRAAALNPHGIAVTHGPLEPSAGGERS